MLSMTAATRMVLRILASSKTMRRQKGWLALRLTVCKVVALQRKQRLLQLLLPLLLAQPVAGTWQSVTWQIVLSVFRAAPSSD